MLSNFWKAGLFAGMRRSLSQTVAVSCVLMVASAVAFPQRAQSAELKIGFAELAGLVGKFAGDVSIRLHNLPGGIFDFSSGSSLSMSGNSVPLPVPVRYFDRAGARYVYYLNDINSTAVSVSAVNGAVRLKARFEADGVELVGRCLSGVCPPTDLLPDIQWARPAVSLDLVPIRFGDSIALKVKRVSIDGRPTPTCRKSAGFFVGGICRAILPYARRIVSNLIGDLNRGLMEQANTPDIQEKLAELLKPYLVLGPVGEVRIQRVSNNSSSVSIGFCFGC